MKKLQRGFSLIELMIVIAIIGILAAIAIPSYQTYVLKSKLGELLSASSAAQLAAAEYVQSSGATDCSAMPTVTAGGGGTQFWSGNDAGQFSYPTTNLVTSVTIDAGCNIEVNGASGQWGANEGATGQPVVVGTASIDGTGNMHWSCGTTGNACAVLPYSPSTCPDLNC